MPQKFKVTWTDGPSGIVKCPQCSREFYFDVTTLEGMQVYNYGLGPSCYAAITCEECGFFEEIEK